MKVLIPNTGYDLVWTNLGRGAFNARRIESSLAPQFINRLKMTNSVPISANTRSNLSLIGENAKRALLIIQNNSTATSPDSAPTFFIGFGTQPLVGFDLALPPGVGIVLDVRVPTDSVFVAFGPFSGASVVIQGVCKEGGVTDASDDTANISGIADLHRIAALLERWINNTQQ